MKTKNKIIGINPNLLRGYAKFIMDKIRKKNTSTYLLGMMKDNKFKQITMVALVR